MQPGGLQQRGESSTDEATRCSGHSTAGQTANIYAQAGHPNARRSQADGETRRTDRHARPTLADAGGRGEASHARR